MRYPRVTLLKNLQEAHICTPGEAVWPGAPGVELVREPVPGSAAWQEHVATEFTFLGAAFHWLLARKREDPCQAVFLVINEESEASINAGAVVNFLIPLEELEWDLDLCAVSIEGMINLLDDEMRQTYYLTKDGRQEFNFYGAPGTLRSTYAYPGTAIETVVEVHTQVPIESDPYAFAPPDRGTGAAWAVGEYVVKLATPQPGAHNHTVTWVREQEVTVCQGTTPVPPPGEGWELTEDCATGQNGRAKYTRELAPEFIADRPRSNEILHYYYSTGADTDPERDRRFLDRGKLLEEVVNYLIQEHNKISPTNNLLPVISDFFGWQATGSHPTNAAYTAAAELDTLLLYQTDDLTRATGSEAAENVPISLLELLDDLREMFQVYWFVENQHLRLEHITYFTANQNAVSHDLTTGEDRIWTRGNKIAGERVARPSLERWTWPIPTADTDFTGLPITYAGLCRGPEHQEQDHTVARINTDLGLLGRTGLPLGGFFLVSGHGITDDRLPYDYAILSAEGAITDFYKPNAALSLANLHRDFWPYYRPYPSGTLNGQPATFTDRAGALAGPALTVRRSYDDYFALSPLDNYQTLLGTGAATALKFNTATCMLELDLTYKEI